MIHITYYEVKSNESNLFIYGRKIKVSLNNSNLMLAMYRIFLPGCILNNS